MDVQLRELAARQADVVAAWQLLAAGWTWKTIHHHRRRGGWRRVHPGVYALTSAPLTRRQLWIAATLTTPDSVLSHASAAACWGFHRFDGPFEIITRPGSGGRRRVGRLVVYRSTTLEGDRIYREGIRITTAARTLIDLAPYLNAKELGRAFREALRLRTTTIERLLEALDRHRGRRGTGPLVDLAARYADIPYHRTRSDAEARALELICDADLDLPLVNEKIAGEEADLTWLDRERIIEIDGPQYHRFPSEDARKQAVWENAGYVVRRVSSDLVYKEPAAFIELARSG